VLDKKEVLVKIIVAWIVLTLPVLVHADAAVKGLKLHSAAIGKSRNQLYVQFETPTALTDCDISYNPPPNTVPNGCKITNSPWTIVVYDASGNAVPAKVTSAIDPIGQLPANGLVTLTLETDVPQGATRVDVTFDKQNRPHVSIEPKITGNETKPTIKSKTSTISAAKTKDDATVYLSGTFAPAVGATPDYTTDSKVSQPVKYFGHNQSSMISLAGTVQTDSKGTADPDGFYWGVPIQHIFTKPYSVQWSVAGMELDKRANAINFVSAPSITGSLDHPFFAKDKKHAGVQTVAASVGLDLTLGVEFGDNLRDTFTVANRPGQGQGGFFRGVPSTTAYLIIPNAFHLTKLSLTSSYTARIPTSDELFLETRHTKTPIPLLTSQTRNWIQNTLQFNLTDYLAVQIKHQYGSIPPAFSFVQNSGSIGLVFSFKQTNVPH
jgi:hypothetical protein